MLVTDNGQPVLGLGPADFEILDNGVPQQVDLVSFDEIPLNVILALDMSDSVAGERLEQLRRAGGGVLTALKKEDQARWSPSAMPCSSAPGLTTDVAAVRERSTRRRAAVRPRWSTAATPR